MFFSRPTASRLRPDYLADFLPEKIWLTFYIEVLPDFLAYYFPRFHVQKDILSYLNITNWPSQDCPGCDERMYDFDGNMK